MPYVFNLNTKALSPLPSHPGADPEEFISQDAIIVSDEQARLISKSNIKERERITTQILGNRLMNDHSMSPEHRKILEAGMKALNIGDLSGDSKPKKSTKAAAKENVVESIPEMFEEEDGAAMSLTLDTGDSAALLSKAKIAKLNQANLVKYAREVHGMNVADNENFEILKRKVYAQQFGEKD